MIREQELNVTVNMTNVLDGKELANGSYAYTTKLQDREQKKSGILRVVNKLGKLGFTFNKIRKDYIQMLGRKRPSWAPVKRKLVSPHRAGALFFIQKRRNVVLMFLLSLRQKIWLIYKR